MVASPGVIYGLSSFGMVLVCQPYCTTPERQNHDHEKALMRGMWFALGVLVFVLVYILIVVQMKNNCSFESVYDITVSKMSKFLNC